MSKRTYNAIRDVVILFGIVGILALLKLAGYIGWSWWWVVSPIWIFMLAAVVVVCVGWIRGE